MMKSSGKYIKFLTYLVVVILVNLAGITLFFRADLTEDRVYSISEASQKVVATLSEPLTVHVFFTRNLPAPHNNTERYLRDLLEEYAIYANRHFNYRFFNVTPEGGDDNAETRENRKLAQNYGIQPVQIQHVEKDEVKFQKAYMGMVLIHGDLIERIPTITTTDGLEYELTTAIQKLNNKVSALLALKEKIRVTLVLSSSLQEVGPYVRLKELFVVPEKIGDAVTRLNAKSYGKLEYRHVDPSKDPQAESQFQKHNLLSLKWPAIAEGKVPAGKGIIGLVMEYQEKAVTLPLIRVLQLPLIGTQYELADLDRMEEMIGDAIESLIDINENLGYLADHGTLGIPGRRGATPGAEQEDRIENFRSLASENYTVKDVSLGEAALPAGIKTLVIAGPMETFTDWELFEIDQFLMRGGSLAFFLDSFEEVMPQQPQMAMGGGQPSFQPLNTGLEKLLSHYGIRIEKAYVLDESCFKQRMPAQLGGGERAIYFAPMIKNRNINDTLSFMENIKGLVTLKASPLTLLEDRIREGKIKAERIFSSSDRSWEMAGKINLNPMFLSPPKDAAKFKGYPLAYVLEGEFPSFFDGKPIPERPVKDTGDSAKGEEGKAAGEEKPDADMAKIEGEGKLIAKGKPARIFVMASSEMLKDNLLDREGRHPNAMFVMNLIDYLNGREEIGVMRAKQQRFNPLSDTTAPVKTAIKSFNIAGLPVLVVIFGLAVWFRRHARKRRIQMMFEK